MRLSIPAVLIGVVTVAGCGGDPADVPLPASGAAYRTLPQGARTDAARTCRDRAAAAAPDVASAELAKVDPVALRTQIDLAVSSKASRRLAFSRLCAEYLPFVTPGVGITFAGATDSGDAYTYQTRSDKPLTIRGRLSGVGPRALVVARREYGSSTPLQGAAGADGRFTLPTVRLRKQANNSFVVAIHASPHALRKVRFSAICLDCLASGSPSQ